MHEFSHLVRDRIKTRPLGTVDFNANRGYLQNFNLSYNSYFNDLLEKIQHGNLWSALIN